MKGLLGVLITFLLIPFVSAAMAPPIKEYCESQGYEFFVNNTASYCIINSNLTCDALEFYAYNCGQNYSTRRPCVELGKQVWSEYSDSCCDFARPYLKPGTDGPATCEKRSQQQRLLDNYNFGIKLNSLVTVIAAFAVMIGFLMLLPYLIRSKRE